MATIHPPAPPYSLQRIATRGLLAALTSALVNMIIYLVASAAGIPWSEVLTPVGEPITLQPVLFTSMVGALGATMIYALLARFTRRPVGIFRWVAVIVLLLSFATPLSLPNAPLNLILMLELMHVVVATISVLLLTREG